MSFVLWLYLITLLLMPFLALIVSSYLTWKAFRLLIFIGVPIFLLYDFFLITGYSLKGDYPDYCMWSLQYFFVFVAVMAYRKLATNMFTKVLRVMIYTAWIGSIVVVPGILLSFSIEMEYVYDKKFQFESDDKSYETRRFSFGFATLENTRYTFNTYHEFTYLPFERRIDESILFDDNSEFDGVGDTLQMSISKVNGHQTLTFKAPGKGHFDKILK